MKQEEKPQNHLKQSRQEHWKALGMRCLSMSSKEDNESTKQKRRTFPSRQWIESHPANKSFCPGGLDETSAQVGPIVSPAFVAEAPWVRALSGRGVWKTFGPEPKPWIRLEGEATQVQTDRVFPTQPAYLTPVLAQGFQKQKFGATPGLST